MRERETTERMQDVQRDVMKGLLRAKGVDVIVSNTGQVSIVVDNCYRYGILLEVGASGEDFDSRELGR